MTKKQWQKANRELNAFMRALEAEHERMYKKEVEEYVYSDLEGLDIFMDCMRYSCRIGLTYYNNKNTLDTMKAVECEKGYKVTFVREFLR